MNRRTYWSNFQASQADVLAGQRAFLHAHHDKMSVAEISQVLEFLESFGPAPVEEKLFAAAIMRMPPRILIRVRLIHTRLA